MEPTTDPDPFPDHSAPQEENQVVPPENASSPRRGGGRSVNRRARLDVLEATLAGATLEQAAAHAGVTTKRAQVILSGLKGERLDGLRLGADAAVARVLKVTPGAISRLQWLMWHAKDPRTGRPDGRVQVAAAAALLKAGERVYMEHPDFQPEPLAGAPMFVLPPGTRVMRMLGAPPPPEPEKQPAGFSPAEPQVIDAEAVAAAPAAPGPPEPVDAQTFPDGPDMSLSPGPDLPALEYDDAPPSAEELGNVVPMRPRKDH